MYRRRDRDKSRNKFYVLWLNILNFLVTATTFGTVIWGGGKLVAHPLAYADCIKFGAILGACDLVYTLINIRNLSGDCNAGNRSGA